MLLLMVVLIVMGTGLAGCGYKSGDSDRNNVSSQLVMTEKVLPEHFYEIADQGLLVQKVTEQENFAKQWTFYRLSGTPSTIDWSRQTVVFLGTIESGSCPLHLQSVERNTDNKSLILRLDNDSKQNACTDDATPRTIVFALDADEVSDITQVEVYTYHGSDARVISLD